MRLKSFYAKTMTEAMQMVRDTLGEDAIIVATREERAGKAVHVTAAVEPAFEIGRGVPSDNWLQYDAEEEGNLVAEELTDALLRHGATEDVMDQIISCATVIGMDRPAEALVASIEHLFSFRPLVAKPSKKPMIFCGPPGAGKTLAVAKIAARSVLSSLNVGVITCDVIRAGGVEQLEAFTRLLRVPLKKAANAADLKAILGDLKDCDQILIDTSGINPFNVDDMKIVARLMSAADMDAFMVLPAATDANESGEMARAFSALGCNTMMPTRIDIARRLGGILSAAAQGHLSLADASNTPKVADGLMTLTPHTLAALLLPAAFATDKKQGRI
jgi:flagellar biosynthesis protein FlhF